MIPRPPALYNLRTLFELRKTVPTRHRQTVARVFEKCGSLGLVDASAIIWPVVFAPHHKTPPTVGTVIHAEVSAKRADGTNAHKYEDDGFILTIENILDSTPAIAQWPNAVIPSPMDIAQCLLMRSPERHSVCFSSPTSLRWDWLESRIFGLNKTRQFFENRGFANMQTPTLVPSGGVEAYVSVFHTRYNDVRGREWPLSMPTSPEFALKKLLAEGFEKVFQISNAYRNSGELSRWHEPEFAMLEWYRVGENLSSMMNETRDLVLTLEKALSKNPSLPSQWPIYSVNELFLSHCDINLERLQTDSEFASAGRELSQSVNTTDDWDSVFCKLFMEKIEPFLTSQKACFVTHYPTRMGALARVSRNPQFVERFEAYLNGVEICNGYHELTDTEELKKRFNSIEQKRSDGNIVRDQIFERTMEFGLPPCAGNALGIDRVLAILLGAPSIAKLLPIPFLSQFPKNTVAPE